MIYEAFLIKIQTKCSFQSINGYKPIQFWEQLHHPKPPQVRASPAAIKFVYSLATVEDLYRRVHYAYVHGILFLYALSIHVLVLLLANLQHPKCLEKCHIFSQIMKLNIHMLNVFQIMPTTLPNAIMHVNQHNTIQYSIVQYNTTEHNT